MEKKWIAGAIKNPGGFHRALDIPMDQKIPVDKLNEAKQKGGKLGAMARLAETLRGFHKE